MRLIVGLFAAVLVALSFAPTPATVPSAEAGLRLKVVPVKWLNTNRLGCGTDGCVPLDTLYSAFSSTKNCTTMVVDVTDLVPVAPAGSVAAAQDSVREIARFFVVSDSAAAGTVTGLTINVNSVFHSAIAAEWEATQPGVSVFSKAMVPVTGTRIIQMPITIGASGSTSDNPEGGTRRALMHPNWRITLTSATGVAGRWKAFLAYYVED